jgi:hypothetical protein
MVSATRSAEPCDLSGEIQCAVATKPVEQGGTLVSNLVEEPTYRFYPLLNIDPLLSNGHKQ